MRTKIFATTLFFLICLFPGSKAGFFDGLPPSALELIITATILIGIFGTPWNKNALMRKVIITSLILFLAGQTISKTFLPVGWNVCIRTSAGAPQGNSACERSIEFPRGKKSFIYETIDFSRENFPLYFLNDTSRFNFLRANNEPDRGKLPFSIAASTFFHAQADDSLLIQSDKNVRLAINDTTIPLVTDKENLFQKIALTPNTTHHIEIIYETNRNKKNILVAKLPRPSFFTIGDTKSIPHTAWATIYKFVNISILILLVLTFAWAKKPDILLLGKSQKITLLIGTLILISFWTLVTQDVIGFKEALFPFSIFLIGSSLLFASLKKSLKRTLLPILFLALFFNSCIFTTTRTFSEEAIIFGGGNDPIGHEWYARRVFLSTSLEEFRDSIGSSVDYYQPLHRYFLTVFHVLAGEPMWGPYALQTFLFSLAILSLILVLWQTSTVSAIVFSLAMAVLLTYEPTSALEAILSPLQQAIALPFIMFAFAILLSLLTQEQETRQEKNIRMFFLLGLSFGTGSMMRTDWLPAFSGILLGIFFILFLNGKYQKNISNQPTVKQIFFSNIIFYKKSLFLFFIGLSIFPFLIGMKNYIFAGQFSFLPTSGFVNLLPEIKEAVDDNISYYENSTGVFLQEIIRGFSGRYDELAEILLKNAYKDIIRPTIVRIAFWTLSVIVVLLSIFLFSHMRKTHSLAYMKLGSILCSFLILIGIGSFFGQHNGIAMIAIYDILVAIILALSAHIIVDRFEIMKKLKQTYRNKSDSLQQYLRINRELSKFLLSRIPPHSGFLDRMKIAYRPYICPFSDLLNLLPNQSSIFDIGCGNGMFLALVSKFKLPKAIGGVEISKKLIDNAITILENSSVGKNDQISIHTFDGQTIPHEIRSYEYIFMIDVLHHIPKTAQVEFLRKVTHTMSVGSKLILKDIDGSRPFLSKFNKLHDLLFSGEIGHELNPKYVLRELIRMNLKIHLMHKKRIFLYPHYTIVCEKV